MYALICIPGPRGQTETTEAAMIAAMGQAPGGGGPAEHVTCSKHVISYFHMFARLDLSCPSCLALLAFEQTILVPMFPVQLGMATSGIPIWNKWIQTLGLLHFRRRSRVETSRRSGIRDPHLQLLGFDLVKHNVRITNKPTQLRILSQACSKRSSESPPSGSSRQRVGSKRDWNALHWPVRRRTFLSAFQTGPAQKYHTSGIHCHASYNIGCVSTLE